MAVDPGVIDFFDNDPDEYPETSRSWVFSPAHELPILDTRPGQVLRTYKCAEQLYQYEKACMAARRGCQKYTEDAGDPDSEDGPKEPIKPEVILELENVEDQRQFGWHIIHDKETEAVWGSIEQGLLEEIHYLKFSQNEDERNWLLASANAILLYCDPDEDVLGIGCTGDELDPYPTHSEIAEKYREDWGQNRLGKALMAVRERIKTELEGNPNAFGAWDAAEDRHRLKPEDRVRVSERPQITQSTASVADERELERLIRSVKPIIDTQSFGSPAPAARQPTVPFEQFIGRGQAQQDASTHMPSRQQASPAKSAKGDDGSQVDQSALAPHAVAHERKSEAARGETVVASVGSFPRLWEPDGIEDDPEEVRRVFRSFVVSRGIHFKHPL